MQTIGEEGIALIKFLKVCGCRRTYAKAVR